MDLTERHPDRPGFSPLYQQVREILLARISTGAWRPAEALPSEQALASELGVSQGTVRKAIDSLVQEQLVERRQGKGTYVAQHTQESAAFRFFKLTVDGGERVLPTCKESKIERRPARPLERSKLDLSQRAGVYVITRDRFADKVPILRETIVVSAAVFSNLEAHQPLPNTLYTFYQSHYGVSIAGATEQIKAEAADKETAQALNVDEGSPVLHVARIATDLTGRPIEYRKTAYLTDRLHYAISLS